jgi:hypothetical protein
MRLRHIPCHRIALASLARPASWIVVLSGDWKPVIGSVLNLEGACAAASGRCGRGHPRWVQLSVQVRGHTHSLDYLAAANPLVQRAVKEPALQSRVKSCEAMKAQPFVASRRRERCAWWRAWWPREQPVREGANELKRTVRVARAWRTAQWAHACMHALTDCNRTAEVERGSRASSPTTRVKIQLSFSVSCVSRAGRKAVAYGDDVAQPNYLNSRN